MKEVKAPIIYRILNLLVKHRLVIFSGSVILALFLFFGCSVAKAEGMSSNQQEVVENYISSELPSFSSSIISAFREHVFPYCQYFGTYKIASYNVIIINFVSDLSVMPVDMHSGWSSPPCQIQVGIVNSYGSRGGLVSKSSKSLTNYYGFRFLYHNGTWSLSGLKNYTGSVSTKYGDTYFGGSALVNYAGTSSKSNSSWFDPWSVSWTKSYGYGPVWIASSSDRQYYIDSANNTEPILYTDDERLKIYKLWSSQYGDSLVLDMTDFRGAYSAAVADSISNVSVTLTINGVETEYLLSDSTSSITDNWSSSSTLYNVSTPYSYFTLSDSYNVYVTKVSFTQTRSSAGGSVSETFYVSCDYLMYANQSNIVPDSPASDVSGTIVTQLEVDERNNIINFDNLYYSPSGGGGTPLVVPEGFSLKLISVTGSRSLASILQDIASGHWIVDPQFANFVINSTVDYITSISSTDAFYEYMEQSVAANEYVGDYDIVAYYWAPDSSLAEVDIMFYYYTTSGKIRCVSQSLADIWVENNKVAVNSRAIYDTLYDFEDKTLQLLNPIYDQEKFIDDKLSSILFAVQNLDIPVYNDTAVLSGIASIVNAIDSLAPADTSRIENKLDSLINFFVANNSTENSSALTYRNWLRGLDDNTNRTVSNFGTLVFDSIHDLFDLFDADYASDDPNAPAHDYIDITSIFINKMNRASLENSGFNKFFRGFFWPDFDPHFQSGTAEGG